ncbi:MAG: hypothetical protein E5Y60_25405 [Mesorhizobium sp.]|nr:MAG: hypothetical protein E5Y60_25405 [Mesorhizobium sp.]
MLGIRHCGPEAISAPKDHSQDHPQLVSPVRLDLPLANRTAYLDPLVGRGDWSWRRHFMRPFL